MTSEGDPGGTVRGQGKRKLSLVPRKQSLSNRCHAGDAEGLGEGRSRGTTTPASSSSLSNNVLAGSPTATTQSLAAFFSDHLVPLGLSATPRNGGLRLAETYLAVCGADGKSDVGGDHHGEGRGQLNGEAAVGATGRQRHRSSLCGLADTLWLQKPCQNIL